MAMTQQDEHRLIENEAIEAAMLEKRPWSLLPPELKALVTEDEYLSHSANLLGLCICDDCAREWGW